MPEDYSLLIQSCLHYQRTPCAQSWFQWRCMKTWIELEDTMWTKTESNARSKPLVAWRKCTRPKRKGGLGVVNLKSQNVALLLKHLDKFYNKKYIPWVKLIWDTYYLSGEVSHASSPKGSFWWKDILKLCDIFRGIASCKVGSGDTILFW
jgi:hypothetical protein